MLYELLLDARTTARKKGLTTNGRKVFVKLSRKYFIIKSNLTYRYPTPTPFRVFFPQKNGKESGSYRLGYLIAVLQSLKRHGGIYNFRYTSKTLEFKSSRFRIKLNSVEYQLAYLIEVIKDRIERGDTSDRRKFSLDWNEEKFRLKKELKQLQKELYERKIINTDK